MMDIESLCDWHVMPKSRYFVRLKDGQEVDTGCDGFGLSPKGVLGFFGVTGKADGTSTGWYTAYATGEWVSFSWKTEGEP